MSERKDKEQQVRDERLKKRQEENCTWNEWERRKDIKEDLSEDERRKEEQSRDSRRNSKEYF